MQHSTATQKLHSNEACQECVISCWSFCQSKITFSLYLLNMPLLTFAMTEFSVCSNSWFSAVLTPQQYVQCLSSEKPCQSSQAPHEWFLQSNVGEEPKGNSWWAETEVMWEKKVLTPAAPPVQDGGGIQSELGKGPKSKLKIFLSMLSILKLTDKTDHTFPRTILKTNTSSVIHGLLFHTATTQAQALSEP